MSYLITTECINCGACEPECPNNAIYEGGATWSSQAVPMVMVQQHPPVHRDSGRQNTILSYPINAQNATDSMRNRSVQRFARLTAVFPTRTMQRIKLHYLRRKTTLTH